MNILSILRPRHLFAAVLAVALTSGVALVAMATTDGAAADPGNAARGMPMGMPGLPMFGGLMGERLLDEVQATAAQREQIRTIMKAAADDLKAKFPSAAADREQALAWFVQPEVDAAGAEAMRKKMMAQQESAGRRMTQVMVDAGRVLSVEQRQQLVQRLAERDAAMQAHRAERRGTTPH